MKHFCASEGFRRKGFPSFVKKVSGQGNRRVGVEGRAFQGEEAEWTKACGESESEHLRPKH